MHEPYATDTLLSVPGERYDVLVHFPEPAGTTLAPQTVYHDLGHDIPDTGPQDILRVELKGRASKPAELPDE